MMTVFVESVLDCPADEVWAEVQRPALLLEVCRPWAYVRSADTTGFPERWRHQTTVRVRSTLFGFLPVGVRTIYFEHIDPAAREIQSREHDVLIRRWDHLVRVQPLADGRSRYSDEVQIEAGWLTFFVWLYAQGLYRHRQRKWRRVARRLAA